MSDDRPLIGILLMLGFCVLAPLADAVAKILGQSVPIGQLVFFRFAVQVALLLPVMWFSSRTWRMRGRILHLVVLRTGLHVLGIGLMVTALQYMPLADAVAISFVMPFLLLVMGRAFLGEQVGLSRVIASVVGFAGTLLIIQPTFVAVGWTALLPLGVALNFALFMIVTRKIARDTDPVSLQAVSGVFAMLFIGPLLLMDLGDRVPVLAVIDPNRVEWGLLLAIGGLGTLAHLVITMSLRHAPAATLAPIQYLEIPMAAIFGWLIFADWPNGLALIGILITVGAGLYVVISERSSVPAPDRPMPPQRNQAAQPAE